MVWSNKKNMLRPGIEPGTATYFMDTTSKNLATCYGMFRDGGLTCSATTAELSKHDCQKCPFPNY